MDPVAALEQLGGYATRAALLRLGVRKGALQAAVRQQRIVRLRRGVYGRGLPNGSEHLRAAAVSLRAVVSHDSAAVLWGLELRAPAGAHVTVPRNRSRAHFPGVTVHRCPIDGTEIRQGMLVTDPLRTVLDCAAILDLPDAVVVADSCLRAGQVTLEGLRKAALEVRGPNAQRVRKVVALADDRSGSVLETLLRVLLIQAGLAPAASQHVVLDERGRPVARVDFAYLKARVIVEADGFEFHRARDDYRNDRRRANAFCRLGWRLLRFSWEDVVRNPDYVVDAVRREVAKRPLRRRRPTNTQSAA